MARQNSARQSSNAGVNHAPRTSAPTLSELTITDPSERTFAWAWNQWRTHRATGSRPFARSTLEDYDSAYNCYIGPLLGDIRLDDITADVVDAFQLELFHRGVSAVRYSKIVVPLRACLRWQRRSGAFTKDMTFWFDSPAPAAAERRVLTFEQADRLIAEMPAYYRPVISTALFTGLRFGEIRALSWRDVDLDSGVIQVHKAMDRGVIRSYTKTKSARCVGLPAHLVEELREWSRVCPPSPLDLVFPVPCGSPIDGTTFSKRYFRPAVKRAGIDPSFRVHDMRHTAASWHVRAGATVPDLMYVFGWSQLQTAMRYIHSFQTPTGLAEKITISRDEQLRVG